MVFIYRKVYSTRYIKPRTHDLFEFQTVVVVSADAITLETYFIEISFFLPPCSIIIWSRFNTHITTLLINRAKLIYYGYT